MPVSKGRKKKPSRRNVPQRRSGYLPTQLPDDAEPYADRLLALDPALLPTVGLAEHYLASSPIRAANQCAIASLTVKVALMGFGLEAEPVALLLDVQNRRGGTTRYGDLNPRTEGNQTIGHVGLIADGNFMDITGAQFPEIAAHGGVRVVAGSLKGLANAVLERGGIIPARLADGHMVQYTVGCLGSADEAIAPLMESAEAQAELAVLTQNLVLGYTKTLSVLGLEERVLSLREPRYARFAAKVLDMRDREITADNGIMRAT